MTDRTVRIRAATVQAETERASISLAALIARCPHLGRTCAREILRRADLFADTARTSPNPGPRHPKLAAIESVIADVVAGRLG